MYDNKVTCNTYTTIRSRGGPSHLPFFAFGDVFGILGPDTFFFGPTHPTPTPPHHPKHHSIHPPTRCG